MDRREFLVQTAGSALLGVGSSLVAQDLPGANDVLHVSARAGRDANAGAREAPLRTLEEAARRVNRLTGKGATTIVVEEGTYALGETAVLANGRAYTQDARLTIRAAVLPDDAEWHAGRMPTIIHTMPLTGTWQGRPDPFGGAAEGFRIETNHVTFQGLKILGMPVVEHPQTGRIFRVYPIARYDTSLDDLLITQCLFAGDELTSPNHLAMLVNGTRLVIDHCVFHGVKQNVVFQTPGSTGHAMRYCLSVNAYACGLWTSGVANDFEFRNNVIANGNYVWITQGARSAAAENAGMAGRGGVPPGPPGANPAGRPPEGAAGAQSRRGGQDQPAARYRAINSLFAGNQKFAGTGGGPSLNFRDYDPSFLELVNCVRTDQPIAIDLDQSSRNYLHAVSGSDAAKYQAGLFKR